MKARQLLESSTYSPEDLHMVREAYDKAWHEISGRYGDSPHLIEAAQLKLAEAVLSVSGWETTDVDELKRRGLAAMDQYRPTSISPHLSGN